MLKRLVFQEILQIGEEINMKKQKGFTLIELLVSIGILAIIVGIGGDILATVIRAYRKAELFSLVDRNGSYALTLIEQDIRSAIDIKVVDDIGAGTFFAPDDPNQASSQILLSFPEASGDFTYKRYNISLCDGGGTNEIGLDTVGDGASFSNLVLSAGGGSDFLGESLSVIDFGYANLGAFTPVDPFVRLRDTAGQRGFDIVYISFGLSAGGATPCPTGDVKAFFQTSVNLLGGLQ